MVVVVVVVVVVSCGGPVPISDGSTGGLIVSKSGSTRGDLLPLVLSRLSPSSALRFFSSVAPGRFQKKPKGGRKRKCA